MDGKLSDGKTKSDKEAMDQTTNKAMEKATDQIPDHTTDKENNQAKEQAKEQTANQTMDHEKCQAKEQAKEQTADQTMDQENNQAKDQAKNAKNQPTGQTTRAIVEDLLQLYGQGLLRDETVRWLEEQARENPEYRELLYRAGKLPTTPKSKIKADDEATMRSLRRKLSVLQLILVALSFLMAMGTTVVAGSAGFIFWYAVLGGAIYLFYRDWRLVLLVAFVPIFLWLFADAVRGWVETEVEGAGGAALGGFIRFLPAALGGSFFMALIHALFAFVGMAIVRLAARKTPLAVALAVLLAFGVLIAYDAFNGNPVSKWLAEKKLEDYLEETYPGEAWRIENGRYNFKFSTYEFDVVAIGGAAAEAEDDGGVDGDGGDNGVDGSIGIGEGDGHGGTDGGGGNAVGGGSGEGGGGDGNVGNGDSDGNVGNVCEPTEYRFALRGWIPRVVTDGFYYSRLDRPLMERLGAEAEAEIRALLAPEIASLRDVSVYLEVPGGTLPEDASWSKTLPAARKMVIGLLLDADGLTEEDVRMAARRVKELLEEAGYTYRLVNINANEFSGDDGQQLGPLRFAASFEAEDDLTDLKVKRFERN